MFLQCGILTPDEVLRLPREDALVIFRGQKVLKVKKFDYTKHPESKKMRDCNARDYIPNWRMEQENPRTVERYPDEDINDEQIFCEISPPVPIPEPPLTPKDKPRKKTEEKQMHENPDTNDDEPFCAIDIDDVLSDL
jgi:type IV secretory pathway TraG/TraD family ATPase VirD4